MCDVDAAIFENKNCMGWGVVVRDHIGSPKLSCSEGVSGVLPPELAKATTIQQSLVITKDKGFNRIILALDCLSVIKKIRSSLRTIRVLVQWKAIADTWPLVSLLEHVGRKLNGVAH
jgi:hypothetical protein